MKILILLLLVLLSFFVNSATAQTAAATTAAEISDADFADVQLVISGTFPERAVTGKVIGVHDGDTATVLDNDKVQYKFRFNGIDAPELKMDFGQKSKQNLSDLIFGKEVTVHYSKVDKYGRFVGTIFVGSTDANLEQIKAGLAWHYKKYQSEQKEADRKSYADAEVKAKDAKLGFWTLANPVAPWDYRTALKAKQEESRLTRKYAVGAKGGCYYLNSSNKKSYVDKKFCAGIPTVTQPEASPISSEAKSTGKPAAATPAKADGRIYISGSRGGCYYLNGEKKVYVKDKNLCSK